MDIRAALRMGIWRLREANVASYTLAAEILLLMPCNAIAPGCTRILKSQ